MRILAAFVLLSSLVTLLLVLTVHRNTVEIASRTGVHVFKVEIADTDAARERGLMARPELPEDHGMLFNFFRDRTVGFWMKNTYIPLDMFFIGSDGHIVSIAENTEPLSDRVISSGEPVRAVLEVKAGTARRLGIQPGDHVANPIFAKPGTAEDIAQNIVRLFSPSTAENFFRHAVSKLKDRAKGLSK
jgi:uncharacterized membrane protein (UPF0127 family)